MSELTLAMLSDDPEKLEAARTLLHEYLVLPDGWERFGGVPARLPQLLDHEIVAFPGAAAPPEGDVALAIITGDVIAAGHIVAFLGDVGEFKRVYVRPEHRRRHTATKLAEAMVDRARALGYHRVVLDVAPERPAAIRLWRSLGFQPCEPYRTYPFAMEFMQLEVATRA